MKLQRWTSCAMGLSVALTLSTVAEARAQDTSQVRIPVRKGASTARIDGNAGVTRRQSGGDVATLTEDAIHSVTNPLLRFTGGIHIYGGDFFAAPRSQWSPETLAEEPSDGAVIDAMFTEENARYRSRARPTAPPR